MIVSLNIEDICSYCNKPILIYKGMDDSDWEWALRYSNDDYWIYRGLSDKCNRCFEDKKLLLVSGVAD